MQLRFGLALELFNYDFRCLLTCRAGVKANADVVATGQLCREEHAGKGELQ